MLNKIERIFPRVRQVRWTSYTPSAKNLVKPCREWKARVFKLIKELVNRFSLKFGTCKEGCYELWTCEDCCGIYLLNNERVIYRPTLREVLYFINLVANIEVDNLLKTFEERGYLTTLSSSTREYPKPIRKGVKLHERKLLRVLRDSSLVKYFTKEF